MLSFRRWVTARFLKALLTARSIPGSLRSHLKVHRVPLSNFYSMNPPPTFAVRGVYVCSQPPCTQTYHSYSTPKALYGLCFLLLS